MRGVVRFPRSAGGAWEAIRDSHQQIRYRRLGELAWTFVNPVGVAELNTAHFAE